MKKLFFLPLTMLFIASSLALVSCSGNDDEPERPHDPSTDETTYTVVAKSEAGQLAQQNGLTSKIDYLFCEYNEDNEVVNVQTWENIKDGTSKRVFVANDRARKLVIQMNVLAYKNGKEVANEKLFIATVYYLKEYKNINIELTGSTVVTNYNPIK